MSQKADQPISSPNETQLLFPQINRVVLQYVKERIVLSSCEREFQDLPDEIGHYGATTAPQRLQMSNIRNRHVIRKLEQLVPFLLPIHRPGTKPVCAEPAKIAVDAGSPASELCSLQVKASVVIQIVDIEFAPSASDSMDIFVLHFITLFRDDLVGGFESIRVIQIH